VGPWPVLGRDPALSSPRGFTGRIEDGPVLAIERRDEVTVVRLEHGPVNALDRELVLALTAAVRQCAGAVVLTGAGGCFSAGVDLRRIVEGDEAYTVAFLAALSDMFLAVFDHPAPTVAAVNGHAIAGGCVLALACDLRLMAAGRIGLTELAVGVPFPAAAREIARYALGPAVSRAVLTADTFQPGEAVRAGLVDDVVSQDDLLDRAVALATRLAGHDAGAYAYEKRHLRRPARDAVAAVGDGDVVQAWTSPATRDRLKTYVATMGRRHGT
jgi:enoyl-CoA hydratase